MAQRPPESLKEVATQLAHLITHQSEDEDKTRSLERELTPESAGPIDEGAQPAPGDDTRQNQRVGIWIPDPDGSDKDKKAYVRDLACKEEFNSWARVNNIPPKSSKKRVVYLGESVSRGYLLDPFYAPAEVLETLLNTKPNLLQAEVIDLARTNCKMPLLSELASSCMEMEPDALVIFAGNNWLNALDLTGNLVEEITALLDEEDRFARLKQLLESQYRELVAAFMKQVNDISKAHKVPVVYVIPEFNLLDYCSNSAQRINLWPREETGKWLSLKEETEQALENNDLERAESSSREMIALNEGNAYGFELLARCMLKRDSIPEAEEYLRKALDTSMFRFQNAPACISIIRDTLIREAAKYEIPVIDLPEVFKQSQSGRLPGRELFLDYCHLTVKGIQVAMAETAGKLFQLLAGQNIPTALLKAKAPKPAADVVARAHFFAAIHNAHRGEQPYEVLVYHCQKALNTSGKVKDLMMTYIDMATRHAVWSVSKECERLFESGEMDQFPTILQPDNHYIMDIQLVDAIVAALKEHGTDIRNKVSDFRKKEHGFMDGKINLLESYYHLESYVASYRPDDSYYRSPAPSSNFFLVTGNEGPVKLKLTYRLPAHNLGNENICVEINGSTVKELSPSNRWQDVLLEIDKETLNDGVNTIIIRWPPVIDYRKINRDDRFPRTQSTLFHQKMYPAYGEIYRFLAEKLSTDSV
ncbi:MAG: hypothetical protein GY940_46245 [bacterium]|nr:hypothetical protein [bacterium]